MILQLIPLLLLFQSAEVPYRAREDYKIELKYNFREKPARDPNTVHWDDRSVKDRPSGGPLPYLVVNVQILNPKAEEMRFKCENNLGKALFNKKADKTLSYDIDMGYLDDVKDRVSPYSYVVYALTDKRQVLNRIELLVMEDGTFMVNGEKRGKF